MLRTLEKTRGHGKAHERPAPFMKERNRIIDEYIGKMCDNARISWTHSGQEIMDITYKVNAPISADQFIELLHDSTLGERRPIQDHECMEGMIRNSNLTVTAWDGEKLVGIARSSWWLHQRQIHTMGISDSKIIRDAGCLVVIKISADPP